MLWLTEDALLLCKHVLGKVNIAPSQVWVSIEGRKVLVETDPQGKSIAGCPNVGMTIFPCKTTLPVQTGYSAFLRVDGRRICLDTVEGLTDGTPPGIVKYNVKNPGQMFVAGDG